YYLADATITLFRRIARREPFWAAHRSHFYQHATNNGFQVARVAGEVFVLNLGLASLALVSTRTDLAAHSVPLLLIGAGLVALVLSRFPRKRRSCPAHIWGSASARRNPSSSVTGARQPVDAALDRSSLRDPIRLS